MNQPQDVEGRFLANDLIPETLLALLTRMFNEQWPVLTNTVKKLETWVEKNPHIIALPRTIGEHDFAIGNVTAKRTIFTFHQWKVQRILNCYHQFDEKQKLSVDTFLQTVGGLNSMQLEIKKRLSRVNNKLMLSQ